MAVVVTVLISAFCTIAALLSMFVFGVRGWVILQIYGAFCMVTVLAGVAYAVFLRLREPKSEDELEYSDVSAE